MSREASTSQPTGTVRPQPVPTGAAAEFDTIYRANVGPVTGFFARRSHDPQVVADLTSETFVEAISSFATFDPARGIVRAWLFGIARHVHLRHCDRSNADGETARYLAGRRDLETDEVEELLLRIDAERPGRDLMRRWQRLPAADRLAVELVDIAGLTPKEAAGALGVSPGALRIRLFRARRRLRDVPEEGRQ